LRLEAADGKSEPNLQPLTILRSVDLICHLWQQYANMALFPLASSSVTIRREMTVFNNQTVSRIEGGANSVLQRVADSQSNSYKSRESTFNGYICLAVVTWLSTQLAKQKRNDFKPRNDDISFARVNTEPCEACCESLERVREFAKQSLGGKNLEIFLTEIGVAFHTFVQFTFFSEWSLIVLSDSLLLDHLRKFPVSATGGLMLAK
jgi:hypothetical protein